MKKTRKKQETYNRIENKKETKIGKENGKELLKDKYRDENGK